ncbi:MAG: hypothetical protein ACXWIN_09045 [Burkholderiaceae bacterium]
MKSSSFLFIALCATAMAHAESALTVRATDLQAQGQSDAATLTTLPENTKVDVLRRVGAWDEVKTSAGQTGWVRMLNLRFDVNNAAKANGTAGSLNALSGLMSTGRTSNTATVTTGVRGLTEEDLKNANANPAELEKMQRFATDKAAAERFAQRTKLVAAKVEYLQESAVTSGPAATPAVTEEPH